MGSSSPTSTTTTQRNEPPAYSRGGLTQAAAAARGLYNQGGPEYFPGSTVAPESGQTQQAMAGIEGLAGQGAPLINSAAGATQNTLSGQNLQNNPALQQFQQFAGSQNNPASQYLNPTLTGSYLNQANNPVMQQAQQLMGAQTGATNPYADAAFANASEATRGQLSSEFGGAGRNDITDPRIAPRTRQLENLATGIYGQSYENQAGRDQQSRMAGFQGLQNTFGNERSNQMNASSLLGNQYGADQSRALQGIQGFGNVYGGERALQENAVNNAAAVQNAQYQPFQQLAGVGAYQDQRNAMNLQDEMSRYNFDQNAPGMNLDSFIARLQGGAGSYGSTSTQQPVYGGSPLMGALGGASTGASVGSLFPGWGTAIGAGVGGIAGLLGSR